ncbi:UDP-galactose 4-epimerase [Prochlorococcus marinus str. MIT 9312]|uniref:UDP-glucose 4-epimerase n=1 Tax=Prochlorococcus marinus (strain MIT 9312) TaxID=74546 RepID=Q319R9_PROM9|nr:UDP-glucose 4-epimerase GalE [Prochlorococcus marinus]ABB50376.1 UDP-galactose 4-epimerase [Prochlorococcus marinus str. MIT 9312]KGF99970.1 UDP-glucose 4-epimerase [Prochlorococcus marinus str. MIT 9311]
MSSNNVLVTGGIGYIGIHTCFTLLERGYNVYVLDSLINSSEKTLEIIKEYSKSLNSKGFKNIFKFYKGDIRNIKNIENVFSDALLNSKPIGGVIHFAGKKSVNESINFPMEYWETNLLGTINLIRVMNSYSCFNFIFSSSASVYGKNSISPIKEFERIEPINPYGNTKATIEKFLIDVFNSKPNSWRIILLRYFNPIGSHPSGLIGESPLEESTNIFPKICEVAIRENNAFKIYGNDWPTKDGTCIRDYIHIMDLVEGHICSYNHLLSHDPEINAFNLGTGKGTSVLELLSIFQEVNKCKIFYEYEQPRKGDVGVCFADNTKAKKIMNWYPKKSINEMCKDGWRWYKSNFKN